MIARQIKPEEVKRTEELFSVSFDFPYHKQASPMELYEQYRKDPKSREEEHPLERFAAFADDDVTMMSSFIMQPFSIRFDGHQESMFSIGGVATLPQYRRQGGIRACFEKALPYLYDKNVVFSYLYPFSTAYYRKFGYELCCKRQSYKVALAHIPSFTPEGHSYLVDETTAAMAAKDIPEIYDAWQKRYNMMVLGESYDFEFIQSANPYKDQIFTYVYRSADEKPLAYMTFCNHTDPDKRYMECSRFFYLNEEGLKGLFSLAKSFASDYRDIRFALPEGPALEQLLPEWSMGAISCELIQNGMVRIINVKKALQDAAYRGSGNISLKVTDSFISENNGIFHVIFTDGVCTDITCSVTADETADISLPVSSLSVLLTGEYDTGVISIFRDVLIHNEEAPVEKIFYKKPIYISTFF